MKNEEFYKLGEVTKWKMSEEELVAYKKKYPPKYPLPKKKKPHLTLARFSRPTLESYIKKGLSKEEILRKYPTVSERDLNYYLNLWNLEE